MPANTRPATRGRSTASGRGPGSRAGAPSGGGSDALIPGLPGWVTPLCVVLGPVAAAVVGKAAGSYKGPGFAIPCVLLALLGAAAAARSALWWAIPVVAPVIWLVGVAAELSWRVPKYQGTKEQLVGVAHGTVHAFPVMTAAVLGMAAVAVLNVMAARRRGAYHA